MPDTYTLYFAVPSSWSGFTSVKIYAVDTNNDKEPPYTLDMQEADITKDGRKIYSADLNKNKHYRFGGLNGLEFWGYKEDTLTDDNPTAKVIIADVNARTWWKTFDPTRDNYIGGNCYDAEGAEGKKWSTYTVTVRHNQFAGKEMSFENKTSETLTNVQAWFYEPNENGELIQVAIALNNAGADSGIALIPQQPLPFLTIIALMFSLHGMRAVPQNPANSITSMVKKLVMIKILYIQ